MTLPRTVGGRALLAPANLPETGDWWRVDGFDDDLPLWARVAEDEDEIQDVAVAADRLKHLDHPGIPRVVSIDPLEGVLVVAAPYGVPLSRLLEHRAEPTYRMTPATVLDVGAKLADIIVHAHERGRPHGHLSPDTLWITSEGELVVWGYAAGPDALGSPCWWAPERARGKRASGDADQWAVAALLSALVTGRVPWQGPDPIAEARIGDASHLAQPVMDQWKPLGRLVERSLMSEPRDRFPSVHPIRQAIDAMSQRVPPSSDLVGMGALLVARYGEGPRHAGFQFVEDPPTHDTEATIDDGGLPTTISRSPPPLDVRDPSLRSRLAPRMDFEPSTDIGTSPTRVPLHEDGYHDLDSVIDEPAYHHDRDDRDDLGTYTVPPSAVEALDETADDPGHGAAPRRADESPSLGDVTIAARPKAVPTEAAVWYERVDIARVAPWTVVALAAALLVYAIAWLAS